MGTIPIDPPVWVLRTGEETPVELRVKEGWGGTWRAGPTVKMEVPSGTMYKGEVIRGGTSALDAFITEMYEEKAKTEVRLAMEDFEERRRKVTEILRRRETKKSKPMVRVIRARRKA